ncbi:MAG: acyl-CoA dehydratase activase [Acidobacteria bacterium]|nr:acyl-CoA dehydratase activase [Acidobacteriota bacterium]
MRGQDGPQLQGNLGVDMGAVAVKTALCSPGGSVLRKARVPNRGNPATALRDALREISVAPSDPLPIAATGSGISLIGSVLQHHAVNEILATALAVHRQYPDARTVIDLGGQFSKWILLGPDGAVLDFASNGLCAAGTGAFLEQQAGRLGLALEELGGLAAGAARGATIAGRCSVFAKSDMIHLQQKGTPLDEIAYGLCQALVRTFVATVMQGRKIELPLILVGGGAENPGLVRAFQQHLRLSGEQLWVPADASFFGAVGAALMSEQEPLETAPELPSQSDEASAGRPEIVSPQASFQKDMNCLPPLVAAEESGTLSEEGAAETSTEALVAYLGVDVGSVSTNLVLLNHDFQLLQGVYLPTLGRPVEALHQGLTQIRERLGDRVRVLGVGATGSGRHLAAQVLGGDVVHNEITAQLVSALLCTPEVDTIFEIGGQDSKFISVKDGTLADFEMNKICAGGTGSFLEEQAARLGINIVNQFSELALHASHPCDLGTRCTVFMDAELVRAQERGAALEDLCAGLAYSVARNYLEKVVAGRPVGRMIVFQGGTASNRAVVAAFQQLLGRPVKVHPYNRISGAIGAALLAARAHPGCSHFLGWESCLGSQLQSFECRHCENRCQINRIQVGGRVVHFGDICELFSQRDHAPRAVWRPFPELFAERERLLERFTSGAPPDGGHRIGLMRATLNLEFLPFWSTFLSSLGYEPVISGRSSSALLQEHSCGLPNEVCLPIKCAAAHARALLADGNVERVFVPALLECPPRGEGDLSHTCFYTQELPDMLRASGNGASGGQAGLHDRIAGAQFALGQGLLGLLEPALSLADALHRPLDQIAPALAKAQAAQARFLAARMELGKIALAAKFDRAAVVLGRPYNTHDPFLNLSLARYLEQVGIPAIPWDLLPLDEVQLDECWETMPWHYSREQVRALELIRRDPRLFPIIVSSYGCGPDGFTLKHAEEMLAGRPRLLLEFDEHRGEAGLVTRLEAFADEIEEYLRRQAHQSLAPRGTGGRRPHPAAGPFFISNFAEHARVFAAALRSEGHEAELLPSPDERTIEMGEAHSSGRECHPYSILVGELLRYAGDVKRPERGVFFFPGCTTPCLLRQYGDALRILLRQQGLATVEVWDPSPQEMMSLLGVTGLWRLYEGLLATDILFVLGTRLRTYEQQPGAVTSQLERAYLSVVDAMVARDSVADALAHGVRDLWAVPRNPGPGTRPVVGVTGDLYTRTNSSGNANLFQRLEEMGCEVWPSPYWAASGELAVALEGPQQIERGRFKEAALDGLAWILTSGSRRQLTGALPADALKLCVEPPVDELIRLARPYLGPKTSYPVLLVVAKIADFLRRGADGVINAAGLNCIVGTATASLIPSIRADYGDAPVISLTYGGSEGPAQRIRLETFVHQVKQRHERAACGRSEVQ